ncbi:unnamed protein product (macronuclear) [Paramecium tetraurelia]|uniref:VWFA domain-containing protein n=1 Tax=Paramecium tetraurelia TaxID=5888 RepID=A0BNG7_PARTE|nr:uncharacterized protein GSPATT00030722001 [Paramecium tetraurelia]CAK60084.1 unnamed protein product [Paramecium tetraurelia]|eukprot:XP_001427482.1 hypothetical protein (macronuclear) [Paramecium tetraurelia strain d4-2]
MELAIVLGLLGFEPAGKSRLNQLLPRVTCEGCTAFRDAVIKGNQLMLELFALFCQQGMHEKFKFVHVILTDGEDNKSQTSLQDFLVYQQFLQQKLPPNILQTFYIGVNVENNNTVQQEMSAILKCSGKSASYYPVSSNQINDIFQKIQMQIGIRVQEQGVIIQNSQARIALRQQTYQPVVSMQVNNYILLFTLDVSGSMSDHWYKVCSAVRSFLDTLGSGDLVLGITFNDNVQVLTAKQQQAAKKTQQTSTPQRTKSSQPQQQIKQTERTGVDSCCCQIF